MSAVVISSMITPCATGVITRTLRIRATVSTVPLAPSGLDATPVACWEAKTAPWVATNAPLIPSSPLLVPVALVQKAPLLVLTAIASITTTATVMLHPILNVPPSPPTEAPNDDDCDPEPTQCLKIWIEGGAVTKGKAGKKASNAYWKRAKKKRNKLLGKKPKKSRRSLDELFRTARATKKCKWTDCKKAHLDGKTWDNFNEKQWKKCCRKNMKYMRKGK